MHASDSPKFLLLEEVLVAAGSRVSETRFSARLKPRFCTKFLGLGLAFFDQKNRDFKFKFPAFFYVIKALAAGSTGTEPTAGVTGHC